ncbi:protein NARROW LEAF 1-like [Gossypium hirsutum]|uniref:Protein NARROW LEAF 1-like n=1 Tax=Gossypium hirsutum TaxID=3635 RepID=A0ABM2ZMC3_GOSHI|nr:protein NARROW LEAF 1-like [Gossypium hirsutum]
MAPIRLNMRGRCSGSHHQRNRPLDFERPCCCHPHLPSFRFTDTSAFCFGWTATSRLNDAAEERANYFANLQKGVLPETLGGLPKGQQQQHCLELMTIRAFHSKILNAQSGTRLVFRIKKGKLTSNGFSPIQCLPTALEGPGGWWCDVELWSSHISVRLSQTQGAAMFENSDHPTKVAIRTMGLWLLEKSTGSRQVGFIVCFSYLDYPIQNVIPCLQHLSCVYLGMERATHSSQMILVWHFCRNEPSHVPNNSVYLQKHLSEQMAFIPFADDFDMSTVTTSVKGVGEIGDVKVIDLQFSIGSLIGKHVMKVGRSSGLTSGTVLAYALEYNDEKGICFLTDFLVVGENQQSFDLEGDSGSLIIMKGENGEKPRPIGIIWGGTANRGRLKLKVGQPPENWTSGVDLGRLLNLLELDIIITEEGLKGLYLSKHF